MSGFCLDSGGLMRVSELGLLAEAGEFNEWLQVGTRFVDPKGFQNLSGLCVLNQPSYVGCFITNW